MRLHKILFANHGASIYAVLVAASGVVLLLSMPSASRLSELILQPWRPFPLPFFLTHTVLSAIMALSSGAAAVPVPSETQRTPVVSTVMARVVFGQFLVLPLVAYSRVLFPRSAAPLVVAAAYILLLSVLMALAGILLEVYASRRGRSSAVLRYGFLAAYMAIPLAGLAGKSPITQAIALASPIQTIRRLFLSPLSTSEWMIAVLIPTATTIVFAFLTLRKRRRRVHA